MNTETEEGREQNGVHERNERRNRRGKESKVVFMKGVNAEIGERKE
ncbi:hypothetical protein [Niallia circulans]|nr:hypothetical protein [Niallia circulans]